MPMNNKLLFPIAVLSIVFFYLLGPTGIRGDQGFGCRWPVGYRRADRIYDGSTQGGYGWRWNFRWSGSARGNESLGRREFAVDHFGSDKLRHPRGPDEIFVVSRAGERHLRLHSAHARRLFRASRLIPFHEPALPSRDGVFDASIPFLRRSAGSHHACEQLYFR